MRGRFHRSTAPKTRLSSRVVLASCLSSNTSWRGISSLLEDARFWWSVRWAVSISEVVVAMVSTRCDSSLSRPHWVLGMYFLSKMIECSLHRFSLIVYDIAGFLERAEAEERTWNGNQKCFSGIHWNHERGLQVLHICSSRWPPCF